MTNNLDERFLLARQSIIEQRFSKLNPQQREAVLATEGPLLLLAGAGSGKTTVLINRIANLLWFGSASQSNEVPPWISEEDVNYLELCASNGDISERASHLCQMNVPNPWNIIAITFTNKAAGELKNRLEVLLGPQALDIWAMTFHSACCRILRRDGDKIGYTSSFTIYDSNDSERVMKDVLRDMGLDEKSFPAKMVLSHISRAKDQLLSPEQFEVSARDASDYRLLRIAQAYTNYQSQLKAANALDFDDLILQTVILLQQNEQVRQFYQRKFQYVLVDEYQDTNHLQYLLASLLAGRYENICVVGDDDQSIYRFRGATIENILSFEDNYQNARTIRLEQNYRSTKTILSAANGVIACNRGRKGKNLWTDNEQGAPIRIYEASNQEEEANFVVRSIRRLKSYRDCVILYRNNVQSNAIEQACKLQGVPYRIIGGTRFFDRSEIKDMIAYLCVINNNADDLRLKRIINQPARGIGPKTMEMAQRISDASGIPLFEVLNNSNMYPSLEKAKAKFQSFTKIINESAELLTKMNLPDFYDELLIRSGYVSMLETKDTLENRTRLENVRELRSSIVNYVANTENASLAGFLEEIALYTDIEQYDASADAVVMMTMHAAKGMEFQHVFLVGMEEGLFPGLRAIGDNEEIEEERRLCYVAFTRAKKTLTLCHARQRMLYGHTSANHASRFISEIPKDCSVKREHSPELKERYLRNEAIPMKRYSTPIRSLGYMDAKRKTKQDFLQGEIVYHDAFGRGMILSVLPTGNDAILEIAFDQHGTKRLMANYAGEHMKKLKL